MGLNTLACALLKYFSETITSDSFLISLALGSHHCNFLLMRIHSYIILACLSSPPVSATTDKLTIMNMVFIQSL